MNIVKPPQLELKESKLNLIYTLEDEPEGNSLLLKKENSIEDRINLYKVKNRK